MLCMCCNKNQATKTKEFEKNGVQTSGFYCSDCFHALFLSVDEHTQPSPAKCPYCGKSKDSVLRSGLVGCANCYKSFAKDLMPIIVKTQGEEAHDGKTPIATDMKDRLKIRFEELQVLIRQRTEEEDIEKVKEYSQESQRINKLRGGR